MGALLASAASCTIRVGHSPDPDDAFMFWALDDRSRRHSRVRASSRCVADIQTLNQLGARGPARGDGDLARRVPVRRRTDYALLPHGALDRASGYGPVVVAREPHGVAELRGLEIVVPGSLTTAYLALRLVLGDGAGSGGAVRGDPRTRSRAVRAEAGLVIHEGQLTYAGARSTKVLDLGAWWLRETGLPLPLGVNVARRDVEQPARCLGGARARRSVSASTIATRRSSTRSASAAASTVRRRTALSRCT